MKSDWKVYVRILKTKANSFINKEKRSLKKMGAFILAVITFTGGTLIFYKIKGEPQINNKPAKVIELKDKELDRTKLFLENVEQLKSGVYSVSTLVFGEENMRMNETFGVSAKDYVVVQGDFRIKYSIDVTRIKMDYDFDKEEVIIKVPKDSMGVDSVEIIGTVKEIDKYKSFGNVLLELLPGFNNDEELKENAINQLLTNSKKEAQNYNKNELQTKAEKALNELIDSINLNDLKYRIEFVDNTSLNIKK